jgi:hypothetical protein
MMNKEEALNLLRRVVTEKGPDTNRTNGLYFEQHESPDDYLVPDKTKPHCIVGHVGVASGVTELIDALAADNRTRIRYVGGIGNFIDPDALTVLERAQDVQDRGNQWNPPEDTSWGAALAAAEDQASIND